MVMYNLFRKIRIESIFCFSNAARIRTTWLQVKQHCCLTNVCHYSGSCFYRNISHISTKFTGSGWSQELGMWLTPHTSLAAVTLHSCSSLVFFKYQIQISCHLDLVLVVKPLNTTPFLFLELILSLNVPEESNSNSILLLLHSIQRTSNTIRDLKAVTTII